MHPCNISFRMLPPKTEHPGILHHFSLTPHLIAFEHLPNPQSHTFHTESSKNTLLFLGGLGDGLLHPHYPSQLSTSPHFPSNWRVVEVLLSSSYSGWTSSTLPQDADEVALAVAYFAGKGAGKVVLMGHSTGAQICMEYVTSRALVKEQEQEQKQEQQEDKAISPYPPPNSNRPQIAALILQAGVSDRESLTGTTSSSIIAPANAFAQSMLSSGRGTDILPSHMTHNAFGPANPSAQRWLSLATYHGGDDYFSSDLPDEELMHTFGRVGESGFPLLVLLSGEDEYMPQSVDKKVLITRWERAVRGRGGVWGSESGVLAGARHALDGEGVEAVVEEVARRVGGFLEGL